MHTHTVSPNMWGGWVAPPTHHVPNAHSLFPGSPALIANWCLGAFLGNWLCAGLVWGPDLGMGDDSTKITVKRLVRALRGPCLKAAPIPQTLCETHAYLHMDLPKACISAHVHVRVHAYVHVHVHVHVHAYAHA